MPTDIPCSDNAIRLSSGNVAPTSNNNDSSMGRVEVCVDGTYSSVSSVGFGSREAAAVCQQVGFQDGGKKKD
jgi:hypothetical protein